MSAPKVAQAMVFGETGLVLLEYVGTLSGRWFGSVTKQRYPFRRGVPMYVDKRDAPCFLELKDGYGKRFFRRANGEGLGIQTAPEDRPEGVPGNG